MSKFKKFGIVPVLLAILLFTVGGTVAFLIAESNEVENSFGAYEISCKVNEKFDENDGKTKKSITVENTGDDTAYIRLALIDYWVDAEGKIIAKNGWLEDFTPGTNWEKGADGFYYFKLPVAKGASTGDLIDTITLKEGQALEVIASAIQADGEGTAGKPVVQAWGSNGGSVTDVEANGNLCVDTEASGTGSGQ